MDNLGADIHTRLSRPRHRFRRHNGMITKSSFANSVGSHKSTFAPLPKIQDPASREIEDQSSKIRGYCTNTRRSGRLRELCDSILRLGDFLRSTIGKGKASKRVVLSLVEPLSRFTPPEYARVTSDFSLRTSHTCFTFVIACLVRY